jgi:predicted nucleic acid-binding protein
MTGVTLDAGALIAVDRGDRSVLALLERAQERGDRVTIPASALAQAIRVPIRQVRLVKLCRHATTDLMPLDGPDATAVGLLLAASRTSDIVDAHVVVCARRAGQAIITSDPDDLARLAPDLELVTV